MKNLISLVYVSSAVGSLADEEILDILHASRTNNERLGITGMLLYKGGNFMQVLEGPDDSVGTLLRKVERDGRHRGVLQLARKTIEKRSFADWSMAFQNLDSLNAVSHPAYSPFLSASLLDEQFRSRPEACYKLLLCFKDGMR
jgi:hypothetical protein